MCGWGPELFLVSDFLLVKDAPAPVHEKLFSSHRNGLVAIDHLLDRARLQPAARNGGLKRRNLPFCPRKLALARFVPRQIFRELTIRPFFPPCISRTNLLTGASGIDSKVDRI